MREGGILSLPYNHHKGCDENYQGYPHLEPKENGKRRI
jgi:hypothetical protein